MITVSEPRHLLFYSADCKYVHRSYKTTFRNATFQYGNQGKSVLRLFDILGSVHSKLENYGFHKQNFDCFRF